MDFKFPSTDSLISQYFGERYCQTITKKSLAGFALDIESLGETSQRKTIVGLVFSDTVRHVPES